MHMQLVNSEAIEAVGYDPASQRLAIRFVKGKKNYEYVGVPKHVYDHLMATSQKGEYFAANIRDRYRGV